MKFIRFVSVHFNKFFEQAINNIAEEYLSFFSSAERQHLVKHRSKLLKQSILEEKLYYLAKAGYRFAIVVMDIKKDHPPLKLLRMFRMFRKKAEFNKKGAVTELKQAGVFVLSDVDVVRSANIISGIYGNVELFNLVRDYSGMNEKMHKYHQLHKDNQLEQSAIHSLDDLFATIFKYGTIKAHQEFFHSRFGIDGQEYVVLAYVSKHRFRKLVDIKNYVGTSASKMTTSLLEKKMLDSTTIVSGDNRYDEYYITGFGEVVLNQVRKILLEKFA